MSLSKISPTVKEEEIAIQNQIYNSIDNYQSIIFSAGAGAGKTHSLIESLKYIIKNYGDKLEYYNQKVMCITYTNVAKNEIKERLGQSELIEVSTIHDRLWALVKNYNNKLIDIHIEKLNDELSILEFNLNENQDEKIKKEFAVFRNLSDELKHSFKNLMISQKDLFYNNYNNNAKDFKEVFRDSLEQYPNILKNVKNFKKIVNTIIKIEKYLKCIENINKKNDGYRMIKYDSKYNSDILHRMIISHDTLLEYTLSLVEKYDLFKQIIIDSYPYILIDEYQDTNNRVIQIMKYIADYAEKIGHKLFVGYFGDVAQNIYNDGVGIKISQIHSGLIKIYKKHNRRSHKEVIDVINNIRNDDIVQESIYEDCSGGSVKFYFGKNDDKQKFIEKYKKKWRISLDNKLHCLVLTNRLLAEFSGFKDVYYCFYNTEYYQNNYEQINTELISNDLSKLGSIPKFFYNIIKFKVDLENPRSFITNLIDEEIYSKLTFSELRELIRILKTLEGNSLGEYVKSIFQKYKETKNKYYKQMISKLMNLEVNSYQGFFNYLMDELFYNLKDEEYVVANEKLQNLLNVDLYQYFLWYEFVNGGYDADVNFHTYHGTKGSEFDNVIIFMENDFGIRNKNKFSNFFGNYNNIDSLDTKMRQNFDNTKNLIYVSCSRAIKNLRILYLDDISDFSKGVEAIFGEFKEFKTSSV